MPDYSVHACMHQQPSEQCHSVSVCLRFQCSVCERLMLSLGGRLHVDRRLRTDISQASLFWRKGIKVFGQTSIGQTCSDRQASDRRVRTDKHRTDVFGQTSIGQTCLDRQASDRRVRTDKHRTDVFGQTSIGQTCSDRQASDGLTALPAPLRHGDQGSCSHTRCWDPSRLAAGLLWTARVWSAAASSLRCGHGLPNVTCSRHVPQAVSMCPT